MSQFYAFLNFKESFRIFFVLDINHDSNQSKLLKSIQLFKQWNLLRTLPQAEQFANSPYSNLVNIAEVEKYFEPIFSDLKRGVEQKIIKNVGHDILVAFIFYPILTLSNGRICTDFALD
jgi:hypothetical protein